MVTLADQMLRLGSHAHLDASWAKGLYRYRRATNGGDSGWRYGQPELRPGCARTWQVAGQSAGRRSTSAAPRDLTLGRGTALSHISKAAGAINVENRWL